MSPILKNLPPLSDIGPPTRESARGWTGERVRSLGMLAIVVFAALLAGLLENDYWLRILFMCGVYYVCAAGMNILVGYAGQKSLGQAGLFAAGAYTAALLSVKAGWNPWAAFCAAGVVAGAFGVLLAMPSLRVKGPYLAMVTLAFGIVVERIIAENVELLGGAQGFYGIKPLTWGESALSSRQWVWLVLGIGVLLHLLFGNLLQGRLGRAFLSLQANEIAAASVGVRVQRTKVLAFVIAAVTCGIGGALVAQQNQYINSDFITFNLSIFILLLVLFGGAGSAAGPFLGAVTLTLIESLLARWPAAQHLLYGALLLFALYVMPKGLAGVLQRFVPRLPDGGKATIERDAQDIARRNDVAKGKGKGKGDGELLAIEGLYKSFGGVTVAKDVSFTLRSGHIHALIGPNGAGKSTLVNMVSGVLEPSRGTIRLRGRNLLGLSPDAICRVGIGRTFQNLRLFGELSVLENVMLGRHTQMTNGFWSSLLGLPIARREEALARGDAMRLLEQVGIAEQAHLTAGSLPYGLQRRVELARALAIEPCLLLLDEPAAGLNPQESAELGRLLIRIASSGLTILMVEHHMDLVMSISDHVVVLDHGVKIAEGTPSDVQRNAAVIEAYLGQPVVDSVAKEEAPC